MAPPKTQNVLSVSLTSFSYGSEAVLGPIDFSVDQGETLALIGPSGVGKSTLLRIIAGLITGFSGALSVTDNVSFVFQEPNLMRWRTARQNVQIPTGVSAERADARLAEVGLAGLEDRFPNQLSLGQQRRLSLARAFANDPVLLLMDEPFVSLDPALAAEMMALYKELRAKRNMATVLVTHVVQEAEALATRIVRLGGHPATIVPV